MPDTALPRPIEPGEIREGDRVVAERTIESVVQRSEFTAFAVGDTYIRPGGDACFRKDSYTWTLLARPTPAPKSWRGQLADELREWADGFDSNKDYWLGLVDGIRSAANRIEERIFGASIPDIPDHGDGCSPWLWDEETDTAWVAVNVASSGKTHVMVQGQLGDGPDYLIGRSWRDRGIAQRLVSWSERGQANG